MSRAAERAPPRMALLCQVRAPCLALNAVRAHRWEGIDRQPRHVRVGGRRMAELAPGPVAANCHSWVRRSPSCSSTHVHVSVQVYGLVWSIFQQLPRPRPGQLQRAFDLFPRIRVMATQAKTTKPRRWRGCVVLVAGARNHRNLPIEILALFSQDTVRPFDAAA